MNINHVRYYVNNWLVDLSSGSIINQETGEQKRLGEYQLKLLDILAKNAGTVLSREQLMNLVWEKRVIGNNSLPNAIHALRLALEDDGQEQRVIKTIPKIGYLLEKEFCVVMEDPSVIAPAENNEVIHYHNIIPVTPRQPSTTRSMVKIIRQFFTPSRLIYTLLSICVLLSVLVSYLFFNTKTPQPEWWDNAPAPTITKNSDNWYSNIEFYEVFPEELYYTQSNNNAPNTILLQQKLKVSLDKINQELINRQTRLYVYFRVKSSILNYAFLLQSPCDQKELSMHISHWRLDNLQLNGLIYKETERKLNEMHRCVY